MFKRISHLLLLMLCASIGYAQGILRYEYWIDSDYKKRTVTSQTAEDVSFQIPINVMGEGAHFLNFRAQGTDEEWGTFARYLFLIPEPNNPAVGYEYWFDNDYNNRTVTSQTAEDVSFQIPINRMEEGVHFLNIRAQVADGKWGNFARYLFVVPEPANENTSAVGFEYWFDNNNQQRKYGKITDGLVNIAPDISKLEEGVHFLNIRIIDNDGTWTHIYRYIFLRNEPMSSEAAVSQYEYWLDNDYAHHKSAATVDGQLKELIDISQLADGNSHFLNVRAMNSDGVWGSIKRYLVYLPDDVSSSVSPIKGYQYGFNGQMTYVPISERQSFAIENLVVPYPDLLQAGTIDKGCKFTFNQPDGQVTMNRGGSVTFSLMVQNKAGQWTTPFCEDVKQSDQQIRTLMPLGIGMPITAQKVSSGDFLAFELNITDPRDYYLHASQSCKVSIYESNGTLLTTLDGEELTASAVRVNLVSGTYYGVVSHTVKNEANPDDELNIRIMKTQNYVPAPQITYQGETVTISCEMADAHIAYSIDGSEPTANYTGPFELNHNAVIKAKASYSDYDDSEVVTYVVNSYQVLPPTVEFTNLQLYMNCTTEDSEIYYTLDGSNPATNGHLYFSPVAITKNCTVRVIAKRNGYNNSEETSLVIDMTNLTCTPARFSVEGNEVNITTLTNDAQIYFTLDGTVPTAKSTLYTEPIKPILNGTIRAIVTRSGYVDSEVREYTVDWLKADKPTFSFADGLLNISSTTQDATIYYLIGGDEPTTQSSIYTSPLRLADNVVVKAIAVANCLNASDVAEFLPNKCVAPILTREGDVLAVKNGTQGATVYYTTDGTVPTSSSMKVENGYIPLQHNGIVTAIALKEDALASETAKFTVDWLRAESPMLSFTDGQLTMSCNTPGSTIYYVIGEGTPSRVYTEPIALTDNRPVTAVAKAQDLLDSETSTYNPNSFTCEPVTFTYNGRYLQLNSATDGASIRYTTDGTQPGGNSALYAGQLTVSDLVTIKAVAMKANTNSSSVTSFVVPAYYDGKRVGVGTAGKLNNAFGWCNPAEIEQLEVVGMLDDADLASLRSMSQLRHLDMSQVKMSGNRLPERAFQGMSLVSIVVPESMVSAGNNLFEGCQQLAAITWLPDFKLTEQMLQGVDNPNLLVYVNLLSDVATMVCNVVVNGHANRITLTDRTEGNANFYCPTAFTANSISYTHSYQQQTGFGECRGWETLALPFKVQTISHQSQGLLAPFAQGNTEAKPFWLCRLDVSGFERTDVIEANTPYIISMPNNQSYADQYILGGQVTFEAQNATVYASEELVTAEKSEFMFVPTFTSVVKTDGVLPLNVGQAFDGLPEGSNFFRDLNREVRPFEAYIVSRSRSARRFAIEEETLGIEDLQLEMMGSVRVFDLRGLLVGTAKNLDELRQSHRLTPGVYLVRAAGGKLQKMQLK